MAIDPWAIFPPLFEKEWYASSRTLFAQISHPVWVHGPGVVATFTANDHPVQLIIYATMRTVNAMRAFQRVYFYLTITLQEFQVNST